MIRNRRVLFVSAEVHFDEVPDLDGVDVVRYLQRPSPLTLGTSAEFQTRLIDLGRSPEAILADYNRDNRYKIKRAAERDGVRCEAIASRDPVLLEAFACFYDRFAQEKQLARIQRDRLAVYASAGLLELSRVVVPAGDPLVWHAHLLARGRARLLHSASLFRSSDDADRRALVGRANRLLHHRDLLRFRDQGATHYDFGGWAPPDAAEALLNINRFKQSFGGATVVEYNCVQALTLRGRVVVALERRLARRGH
jgi:hypothetical protein